MWSYEFYKFHKKTLALESLFNKVAGLIIAILIMVEHSNEEKVKRF